MKVTAVADFIFYVKDLASPDLCRRIIELYRSDINKAPGLSLTAQGEEKVIADAKLSIETVIEETGVWKATHDELSANVIEALRTVISGAPALQILPLKWTAYKIKHYEKGKGHFSWHFDALGPGAWERQLALIIYLNAVDEGGETCFLYQNLKVKPEAGAALIFPPFWTHYHCGSVPVSGDKFIITSFVAFALDAASRKAG